MRHILSVLSAALLLSATSNAQEKEIEYGNKQELRGVKVVFIDSGTNLEFRENAIELLKKELSAISVADRIGDAEILLQVSIVGSDRGHGHAQMLVLRGGSKTGVPRLIAKYEDAKTSIFTRKLSTVLMHRFIHDYLEANKAQAGSP